MLYFLFIGALLHFLEKNQKIKRDFTDGKKMSPVEYCEKQSRGAVQRLIRKPSQYKM